jgi:carbonic anhydrase/acetyltransferase-like protein (isoleucine patch superfamily)
MPLLPFESITPTVAGSCFVAPGASVIGDVVIGERSSVWFGTVIRGDVFHIRIGRETNIQDNSVIHVTTGKHATIVGDHVTVGHRAILHGCTVQEGSLIGMGAIVMDRAVVGARSLVAAGALVVEGSVLPEESLIMGSPAKVKRRLTADELKHLSWAAAHYAELAEKYARKLGFGH